MKSNFKIRLATIDDIESIVSLFDTYRIFYGRESDIESAKSFPEQRIHTQSSFILLAEVDSHAVGFLQAYPGYSSVSMNSVLILNDLFVSEEYRNQRIAENLIIEITKPAKFKGNVCIKLATMPDNVSAQKLYKKMEFKPDAFSHYILEL